MPDVQDHYARTNIRNLCNAQDKGHHRQVGVGWRSFDYGYFVTALINKNAALPLGATRYLRYSLGVSRTSIFVSSNLTEQPH